MSFQCASRMAVCPNGQHLGHPVLVGLGAHLPERQEGLWLAKQLLSLCCVLRFCKKPRLTGSLAFNLAIVPILWKGLWFWFFSKTKNLTNDCFSLKCHWYRSCCPELRHPRETQACLCDFCRFLFTDPIPLLPLGFGSLVRGKAECCWCPKPCTWGHESCGQPV